MISTVLLLLFSITGSLCSTEIWNKKPIYKVGCSSNSMVVDVVYPSDATNIYLQNLKNFHEPKCEPRIENNKATFSLNLDNIYECMMTRVKDQETGQTAYFHKVIMEYESNPKQIFLVKCDIGGMFDNSTLNDDEYEELSKISKRSAQVPITFDEPDYEIEITKEVSGRAPIPVLNVEVRQAGLLVNNELTVKPGTPLSMDIFLDDESLDIYGVMVSNMLVSDMSEQEEILILNGCTVDPYLFENFQTEKGDLLRAGFKAFKFPSTNVVLFKANVNVCLDKCEGIECANDEIGYGKKRKRRNVPLASPRRNKVYEVSMSTLVRVSDDEEITEILDIKSTKGSVEPLGKSRFILGNRKASKEGGAVEFSSDFGAEKYVDFEGYSSASSSPIHLLSASTLALLISFLLTLAR
ncbi:uncharacterized protein qsm isoform X1 [Lepeophtheirus salmonis]|uniref:uncharacterized protein qsm isoform X1 n=1 Tax=Lepeophtheirus salmonis TaxID=72036 RepID=UPI001AE15B96|nr:uncharacterized protein LOC121131886 isoform X1 [Lepeophtheirus salmonis]